MDSKVLQSLIGVSVLVLGIACSGGSGNSLAGGGFATASGVEGFVLVDATRGGSPVAVSEKWDGSQLHSAFVDYISDGDFTTLPSSGCYFSEALGEMTDNVYCGPALTPTGNLDNQFLQYRVAWNPLFSDYDPERPDAVPELLGYFPSLAPEFDPVPGIAIGPSEQLVALVPGSIERPAIEDLELLTELPALPSATPGVSMADGFDRSTLESINLSVQGYEWELTLLAAGTLPQATQAEQIVTPSIGEEFLVVEWVFTDQSSSYRNSIYKPVFSLFLQVDGLKLEIPEEIRSDGEAVAFLQSVPVSSEIKFIVDDSFQHSFSFDVRTKSLDKDWPLVEPVNTTVGESFVATAELPDFCFERDYTDGCAEGETETASLNIDARVERYFVSPYAASGWAPEGSLYLGIELDPLGGDTIAGPSHLEKETRDYNGWAREYELELRYVVTLADGTELEAIPLPGYEDTAIVIFEVPVGSEEASFRRETNAVYRDRSENSIPAEASASLDLGQLHLGY